MQREAIIQNPEDAGCTQNIIACCMACMEQSFFNLRYPFWHDHGLKINDSEMTELFRAALRECSNVLIKNCDIISPEFLLVCPGNPHGGYHSGQ